MSTLTFSENLYTFTSDTKMLNEANLSTRLVYAMKKLGVNQSELARRIGVKPQVIQYLCTNNAERSRFAFEIADALGVNLDWLIAGKGRMMEKAGVQETTNIPLINWTDIRNWVSTNRKEIKPVGNISSQVSFSQESYALKMVDSSMTPRFEVDTTLIVDPEITAHENDFVIVSTEHGTTPILRQLITKNSKPMLVPINAALYKEIEFCENNRIFGVLRQTFYEFARR